MRGPSPHRLELRPARGDRRRAGLVSTWKRRRRIPERPLTFAAERGILTVEAHMQNPWRQTLGDILHRSAARHPRKTAIVCGDGSWPFAELDEICDRAASGLAGIGVRAGDRVAILSRNSHAFAAFRFALARLGAVLVPINFMLNADEIAFILRSSGATALAVGPDFVDIGRAAAERDTKVGMVFWLPGETPA